MKKYQEQLRQGFLKVLEEFHPLPEDSEQSLQNIGFIMLLANRKNQLNSNKDSHHFLKEDVIDRKMAT